MKLFSFDGNGLEDRERTQAIRIYNLLMESPENKVVILSGFDHLDERNKGDSSRMAGILKYNYDINPLTIDQTMLNCNKSKISIELYPLESTNNSLRVQADYYINNQLNNKNLLFTYNFIGRSIPIEVKDLISSKKDSNNLKFYKVYLTSEFNLFSHNSIPILNKILKTDDTIILIPNDEDVTICFWDGFENIITVRQFKN